MNGIFVKPGTCAQIVVTRIETKNLPKPYGTCIDIDVENINTILSREMSKFGMVYSRRNCLDLCEQKSNIDSFGCNSLLLPRIFDAPLCTNRSVYNSVVDLYSSKFNMSACSDLCPIECSLVTYDTSILFEL